MRKELQTARLNKLTDWSYKKAFSTQLSKTISIKPFREPCTFIKQGEGTIDVFKRQPGTWRRKTSPLDKGEYLNPTKQQN